MKPRNIILTRTLILCLFGMAMPNLVLAACDPGAGYGGRFVLSIRDCTGVLDADNCAAATSPIESYDQWCQGLQVSASISSPGFGFADGSVQYNGPAALPTVRQAAITTDDSRNGSTIDSWQVYTYGGAGPIVLPIVGDVSYDSSGDNGNHFGVNNGNFGVNLLVFDGTIVDVADFLQSYSGYRLGAAECGDEWFFGLPDGAIIAQDGYYAIGDPAGAAALTLDVSTGCDGNPVMVDTGDSFIVAAYSQTIGDRGGYVDMSHTLNVTFAKETPPEVLMQLVDNIVPACEDCGPEQVNANIQIKTGKKGDSCLNTNKKGSVSVSVMGSDTMDVSKIRLDESLVLGSLDIPFNTGLDKCKEKDINKDDFADLTCKFKTGALNGSHEESIEVLLRGKMIDGTPIEGVDTVCLKP